MAPIIKSTLGGLAITTALAVAYVLKFGLYPQFFDIEWNEEVLLHDRQVIVVHVKRTYERRDRFSKYEHTSFRRNELLFDSASGEGRITLSSRLGISYLDRIDGIWYAVLFGQGPYGNYPDEMPDRWGRDYTVREERLVRLVTDKFMPVSWDSAPPGAILHNNLVVGSMPLEVLAGFDGKKMSLDDKKRLRADYPPGPGGGDISSPIRMQQRAN